MKNVTACLFLLLQISACQSVDKSGSKIIGGVEYKELPAVGKITKDGKMHCTASLIRTNRIVTAAHCLDPRLYSRSKLIFVQDNGPAIPLKEAVLHPLYDSQNHNYDIAYADLEMDSKDQPLLLYSGDYSKLLSQSLLLVGYGADQGSGEGSGVKRSVSMRVAALNDTKIRFEELGKSACSGDSGGPAFSVDASGRKELVGITSCGASDCDSYGVYTRLDPFLGFLGLTERSDQALEIPLCGKFGQKGTCEGDELVSCKSDCYEAKFTRTNCSSVAMRCASDSHSQRCLSDSFRSQSLVFKKLTFGKDGDFKIEPYKSLGVFIDNESAANSLYGTTDAEGVFRDYLENGEHSLRLRYGDRSYSPAGANRFYTSDQASEFLLGDAPVQIKLNAKLDPGFAYYISAAGPLFRNYSVARRFLQKGDDWVYEDALPRNMPYRIIKLENSLDVIAAESGMWGEGEKMIIPDRQLSNPNEMLTIQIDTSKIRE